MSVASEKSEKMSRPYSSEGKPEEVVTTDIEDSRPYGAPAPLKRALKNRHVAMIRCVGELVEECARLTIV